MYAMLDTIRAIDWKRPPSLYECLPDGLVRGLICFALVLGTLYLEWVAPEPGAFKVPDQLKGTAGVAVGFYLGGDTSPGMRALLSLIYVTVGVLFFVRWGWAPESVWTTVGTVIGLYFVRVKVRDVP